MFTSRPRLHFLVISEYALGYVAIVTANDEMEDILALAVVV